MSAILIVNENTYGWMHNIFMKWIKLLLKNLKNKVILDSSIVTLKMWMIMNRNNINVYTFFVQIIIFLILEGYFGYYLSNSSLWSKAASSILAANRATSSTVVNFLGGNTIPGFELTGSGMGLAMYMSFSQYSYACNIKLVPISDNLKMVYLIFDWNIVLQSKSVYTR